MTTPIPSAAAQHAALLSDMRHIGRAMPASGALNQGGKPYHPTRYLPKVESCADDPAGLVAYAKSLMHSPPTEGYSALVKADRLDLAVESLVADDTKIYASLFTDEDRAAARARLAEQHEQVAELKRQRETQLDEEDDRLIAQMNERRRTAGKPLLTTDQAAGVRERRRGSQERPRSER